ncbi:MAG TPA: hypothetical protein VF288_06165 [Mycobacteriales bacterium]
MPSRRAVVVGLSAATAVAAGELALGLRGGHRGTPAPAKPSGTVPSDPQWRAAAGDERALIETYESTTRAHPALAATLALPLAHHRAHLAALTGAGASSTSVPPTTTSSGPPPDTASVADHRATLGALQARETAAAAQRSAAAVRDPGDGGTLLARIAAAEAVHVDYLAAAITAIRPPAPTTSAGPRRSTASAAPPSTAPRSTSPAPPHTTSDPAPPHTTSVPPRPAPSETSPRPSATPSTPGSTPAATASR